jgi:two-component system response regulator YesN
MGVTIGSGRTYKKVEYLQKSCKEAVEALRYGEFINEKGWTRIDDIDENPQLPEDLSETEKTLIYFMRIGDKEGYLETLWDIAAQLQQEKLHRGVLEREIVKMMYSALEVAKETGNDFDKSLQHFVPHLEIRELKSKEGVYNWFTSKMEMIMDWSLNVRGTKRHSAIEYSCLYMEKHYGRDLSLQEVAEKAEMNPTYFSLLFKEKMGQSYIKYLTSIRMEKAKNFLLKGEKVTVVSEKVGYNSHRHFSVIFKKYFGVPPGHFKENEKLTF